MFAKIKEKVRGDDYYKRALKESLVSAIVALILIGIGVKGLCAIDSLTLKVLSGITLFLGLNQLFGFACQFHSQFLSEDD